MVAQVSYQFQTMIAESKDLNIHPRGRGVLKWDMDTFLWNHFAEKFGSNPSTPYMYSTLPLLLGGFLPSPMWSLQPHDAVVLLFKKPPAVDYFSFTTFCLASWKRGFVFASLGDSLNSHSSKMVDASSHDTVFAHVVVTEGSVQTLESIQASLQQSGINQTAIHVAVIPNALAQEDSLAHYEVVLRLFRFHNQTEGDLYLQSKQPVFYIQGAAAADTKNIEETNLLPKPFYKERSHPDNINEPALLQAERDVYQNQIFSELNQTFVLPTLQQPTLHHFSPLYIRGLHCLENMGHQCLGDCPDAAYFGSNIEPTSDLIQSLILPDDDEFHLVVMVDHRQTKASIYSSIALLKTHKAILNKTKLEVRGTSIGVLSNHEYHRPSMTTKSQDTDDNNSSNNPFFSWIFTRNPEHCRTTRHVVQGCTVINDQEVSRDSYFAYCERLYLNPTTGIGPDWDTILPAQLYHFQNVQSRPVDQKAYHQRNVELFAQLRLPPAAPSLAVFSGDEKFKFLHIVKTGGEAFEGYLGSSPSMVPQIDYPHCRQTAMANLTSSWSAVPTTPCWAITTTIGVILCGLNCECCAGDFLGSAEGRGFHGTLIRSPRAHTLSLFNHGHNAHHSTLKRAASDITMFLAESVLIASETLCGHAGTAGDADWKAALEDNLRKSLASWPPSNQTALEEGVQVISLRNTQSHSLTCGKSTRGSLAQHYRVLPSNDALEPSLQDALESLHRMAWIGITDLYHPSLCLLHYQANQTLPATCDCRNPQHHAQDPATKPLGHWVEYRTKKRSAEDLSAKVMEMMDAHTSIDVPLFAAALRLVLGRLRRVEELTGASLLECIDWQALQKKTDYIPGLWTDGPESFFPPQSLGAYEESR